MQDGLSTTPAWLNQTRTALREKRIVTKGPFEFSEADQRGIEAFIKEVRNLLMALGKINPEKKASEKLETTFCENLERGILRIAKAASRGMQKGWVDK